MRRFNIFAETTKKEYCHTASPVPNDTLKKTRGVERLDYPEGISNSELWNCLIVPRTQELKKVGKRLIRTPRVL